MILKCIGGDCDGELIEVFNHEIGNLVRVQIKLKFSIISFDEELTAFRENRTPKSSSIPYALYRVAILHFSKDDTMEFLVPNSWSDKDAIRHQFLK